MLACALALSGCKTPIGVDPTGFEPVYRDLRSNVLDAGQLSLECRQNLAYFALDERFREDPEGAIAELERITRRERVRELEVQIAELSYWLALRTGDQGRFLAAAVHAYLYLFGEGFHDPPNPYAPRFRLACDIYNRSLARAFLTPAGTVDLVDRDFETPTGTVAVRATRPGFPWSQEVFSQFLPADAFQVRGLRERVRDPGLGLSLIAVQSVGSAAGLAPEFLGRQIKLPATAFLHVHGGLDEFLDGELTATLELHLGSDVSSVQVGQERVPLEADITAPLAHSLEDSLIWDFGTSGFLKSQLSGFEAGVFMLQPYQEGKVPLVLIHGTASSPATWAQTINGLLAHWRVRSRYQVWLGLYNTGNPVLYSASILRERLKELCAELDPQGVDSQLSNMVLVGHSQGGLVTRLLVSESGDRIWESALDEPFEVYPLEPEVRALLEKTLFFEPLPFVRRAVFISTPHRGSYMAGGWIGKIARKLVSLPGDLVDLARFADLPPELRDIPTSVENMDPDNRFVRTLGRLPFGDEIALHSIVAVKPGQEPLEEGNDGVVEYSSAHLEQADSELVVRFGHSCQGRPETIGELSRILIEHLEGIRYPVLPEASDVP
jgi:pimeloyl-ACP methyl ester carboxylesterase